MSPYGDIIIVARQPPTVIVVKKPVTPTDEGDGCLRQANLVA